MINIYLAHYNSLDFDIQFENVKYFIPDSKIYITIDSDNQALYDQMNQKAIDIGANPILMPFPRLRTTVHYSEASMSFGLSFNYVYQNYIIKDEDFSIFIENDVFFINDFKIDDYEEYEIAANIRFDSKAPFKFYQTWLGFIIFNNKRMSNRELFNGAQDVIDGFITDSGGASYHWLKNTDKSKIRHIRYTGEPINWDPFNSPENVGYNIINISDLPQFLQEGYRSEFMVVNHEDKLLHLCGMAQNRNSDKLKWFYDNIKLIYNK